MTALAWGPYVDAAAEDRGRSTKILADLLAEKNIKLIVDFYPWERAKKKAESREYVGYFPAWPEEVREGFISSPPIDWSEIGIIKKTGSNLDYNNLDQLFKNYRIGIVSTYVYPDEIDKYIKKYNYNIDKAPNELSLIKKLLKGRNQAVITDPRVINYYAVLNNYSGLESVEILIRKELVAAMRDDEENSLRIKLLEQILKKSTVNVYPENN